MAKCSFRVYLIGFIWLVTAVDIYCLQWLTTEWNPLAAWIIATWGVWAFAGLKVLGTWAATEWLRRLPIGYSWTVAALMLLLLLTLGTA